ncbi:hypothetical protein KP509_23G026300 [Ceratopteris richardii]|nr:hypothetical protein KP509_23G026300 [Ceratopteris richardii]
MIAGYTHNSQGFSALELFGHMHEMCVEPSTFTFSAAIKACSSISAVCEGRLIHNEALKRRYEVDLVVASSLISMYIDCGSLEEGRKIFERLPNSDIVLWDILISGHVANGHCFQALDIYWEMLNSGIQPNVVVYLSVLQACAIIAKIDTGKYIHSEITEKGLDIYVIQNALIDMYTKCGLLSEALELFEHHSQRDIIAWGALTAGFVEHGFYSTAIYMLDKIVEERICPNRAIFLCILKACSNGSAQVQGMLSHKLIVALGLDQEISVGNALIDMYLHLNCLEEAQSIFDKIPEVDELSFGLMLPGYVNNGQVLPAFELFDGLIQHDLKPNLTILLLMLSTCSTAGAVRHGRHIHMHGISNGFDKDLAFGSATVDMYSKCGNLKDARKVFDGFPLKDVVLYGSMVGGYAHQGRGNDALWLFIKMNIESIEPSKALFLSLLKAITSIKVVTFGFLIHHYCCEYCLNNDAEIGTSLLDLYSKCGYMEDCLKVFVGLGTSVVPSWCAIISACLENGRDFMALELYVKMQNKSIQADVSLLLAILKACITVGARETGRMVHGELVKIGGDFDITVRNRISSMYAGFGMSDEASQVLGNTGLEDGSSQMIDVIGTAVCEKPLFSPMSTAYSCAGMLKEACCYYGDMMQSNDSHLSVQFYSCVVDLLGRTGHLEEAEFFAKTVPLRPDYVVQVSLLTNSKTHTALSYGQQFFGQVDERAAYDHGICDAFQLSVGSDSGDIFLTMQCKRKPAAHQCFKRIILDHVCDVNVPLKFLKRKHIISKHIITNHEDVSRCMHIKTKILDAMVVCQLGIHEICETVDSSINSQFLPFNNDPLQLHVTESSILLEPGKRLNIGIVNKKVYSESCTSSLTSRHMTSSSTFVIQLSSFSFHQLHRCLLKWNNLHVLVSGSPPISNKISDKYLYPLHTFQIFKIFLFLISYFSVVV